MNFADVETVAIIGAGVAGLATAKALLAQGFSCTVYERSESLGGVWADGYVGFGVQVQKELYEFPDFPLPPDAPNFTPGPVFQKYLEDYCDHFGVRQHLRLGTRVVDVTRDPAAGWALTVEEDGASTTFVADLVVVATGLYSEKPNIPEIPGSVRFSGKVLHAYEVKDREALRGRRVAVIGYGKSATDIAGEAAQSAEVTYLVFRNAHWPVPRKLAGVLPFKWGMLNRLTAALIPPYVRPTPLVRWLHGIGRPLPWIFWRLVEILLRLQFRLDTRIANGRNLVPDQPVEIDAFGESTMVPRPDFIRLIRSGKISAHRTGLAAFTEDGIELEDGSSLKVDTVVFATGWKSGYSYLSDDVRAALGGGDDGFYLYRHMLHPDTPGLVFIGRASSFLSVTTYTIQAQWLAALLTGRVTPRTADDMRAEISRLKAWKQAWMPIGPARSARVLLHMAHYHDELLRDFGADPLRKTGILKPLKELALPYQSRDYAGIASGQTNTPGRLGPGVSH